MGRLAFAIGTTVAARHRLFTVPPEEVPSNPDGHGKTLVKDATSGDDVYISGTFQACLVLMFAIVKAIGKYPSRCADGIFRNAFNKVMDLTVTCLLYTSPSPRDS